MIRTLLLLPLLFLMKGDGTPHEFRAYSTFADYQAKKPSVSRDDVHMNGAFKGEGVFEKFVDEDDKPIGFSHKENWGFTYDSVLFRCLPDQIMNYAAVRQVGERLYFYYRGSNDLRLMANREYYGKKYPMEVDQINDMHGLLEIPFGIGADLGSPMVLFNGSKKDFHEIFGKYYKEAAIDEFKKAIGKAGSDKARFDAMIEFTKGAK